jgi:hypothetical protein
MTKAVILEVTFSIEQRTPLRRHHHVAQIGQSALFHADAARNHVVQLLQDRSRSNLRRVFQRFRIGDVIDLRPPRPDVRRGCHRIFSRAKDTFNVTRDPLIGSFVPVLQSAKYSRSSLIIIERGAGCLPLQRKPALRQHGIRPNLTHPLLHGPEQISQRLRPNSGIPYRSIHSAPVGAAALAVGCGGSVVSKSTLTVSCGVTGNAD